VPRKRAGDRKSPGGNTGRPADSAARTLEHSGASFIYRESNSRYIGVQYSVEGRDLAGTVADGQRAIADIMRSLPPGYRIAWGGEYSEFLAAKKQLNVIGPLALVLIFLILFALYGNFKFPVAIALGVVMTEPAGALIALKLTGNPFSVSSILGLLALMGVSVETAVILVSYINKLRIEEKMDIRTATFEASLLRLRPIMMAGSGRLPGLAPCGAVQRHRFGFAEAFRHRHRGWADLAPFPGFLCQPAAVSGGRPQGRRAAGMKFCKAGPVVRAWKERKKSDTIV
jgi:Cu/Ag efflux pump CusA